MDCFASLAMTAENSRLVRQFPAGGSLGETFATPREHPLVRRLKIRRPRAIHLFSNDNAKFY